MQTLIHDVRENLHAKSNLDPVSEQTKNGIAETVALVSVTAIGTMLAIFLDGALNLFS